MVAFTNLLPVLRTTVALCKDTSNGYSLWNPKFDRVLDGA